MTVFCRLMLVVLVQGLLSLQTAFAADISIWYSHQSSRFVEGLVLRFEQETGKQVSLAQFKPSNIKAELLLGAQYGGLPDLALVPSDFLGLHQQMRLKPISEQLLSTDLSEGALKTAKVDNVYWGVPVIQGNHLMLFYNKKFVDKPVTSWQDLTKISKQYRDDNLIPIGWNYTDMYFFMPFLFAFNGHPLDGDAITLDTPEMVEALNYYQQLSDQKVVDNRCNYNCSQQRLIKGEEAYAINGDWAYQDLKDEMGDDFGVALLPTLNSKPMYSMKSTFVFILPDKLAKTSEEENTIDAFLTFIQREDNQKWGYQNHHLLPVHQALFQQVVSQAKGDELVLLQQLQRAKPMSSETNMAIVWAAMEKGYQRFKNGLSAKESARYMQKVADKQSKRLR
ncbi:MAG: extracellular solute-binding protein [Photobacterium frigidiphilum]|uniref:sugar ABC transporter substrate-binding protein n=1 Tax=Photobacterium frigidiphilum TaxID=264736 RepID=UPI0030032A36